MPRFLASVALLALACAPHVHNATDANTLVLGNVTLIDGTGAGPRPGLDVLIENGRIARIVNSGSRLPHKARVLDLSGRYVLPGLIDTHAHVTVLRPERDASGRVVAMPYDDELSRQALRLLLDHGVTAVRNPGAPAAEGVALREAVARGTIAGPRIVTAGDLISSPRLSESDARAEVRRQAALGVDLIKVYSPIFPPVVAAVIDEAHAAGLRVVGHLQRTTWTEAIHLGIDSITHGAPWAPHYLSEQHRANYVETMRGRLDWLEWVDLDGPEITEMIALLARHRVPVDPTLIAYHTKHYGNDPLYTDSPDLALVPELASQWRRGSFVDDWTASDFERARRLWPRVAALVRRYHEAGVVLTAGSDMPNPWIVPGRSLHHELQLLVDAGIPPLDVITIATRNGAEVLGLLDEIGTVEPGKVADLLVLSANPLEAIENTLSIELVIRGGVITMDHRGSGLATR